MSALPGVLASGVIPWWEWLFKKARKTEPSDFQLVALSFLLFVLAESLGESQAFRAGTETDLMALTQPFVGQGTLSPWRPQRPTSSIVPDSGSSPSPAE